MQNRELYPEESCGYQVYRAACWRGLLKKGMTLVVVLVAVRLDIVLGTSFVREAVVIAYIVNETISIIENAGLLKKGMTLVVVLVAVRLDIVLGTSFVREAVVIAYIVNETISIIENAGRMGLPIPDTIMKAIEQLQGKTAQK